MTDAERYRRGVRATLEQLAWVIDYLHKIGKPQIADALRRNWVEIDKRARLTEDR